jgi:hypothetical protein
MRKRPPLLLLPAEEQEKINSEAAVYERVIGAMKGKNIPLHVVEEAAAELGCHENTIRNTVHRIIRYTAQFEGSTIVDALVPAKRGPEKGTATTLTEQQRKIIDGMLVENRQYTISKTTDTIYPTDKQPDFATMLATINRQELGNPVEPWVLRRYIHQRIMEDPLIHQYAAKIDPATGRRFISTNYGYKIWIDFGGPDECWISDARPLPIYVIYQDRLVIVTLVLIADAFSEKILAWRLVPREVPIGDGTEWKKTDFTKQDVCEMSAEIMRAEGHAPYLFYVDNGSQYRGLQVPLSQLRRNILDVRNEPDDRIPPIEVRHSEPYRPNGRGLIEWLLGFTDLYFQHFPGFFIEDTLANRERAKKQGCMEFEKLNAEFEGYTDQWNNSPRGGARSPAEKYRNTPRQSLPAPSPLQLAILGAGGMVQQFKASAHDDGLRSNNHWFAPLEKTAETYHKLAIAAARRQQIAKKKKPGKDEGKIPMLQVPLLDGTYLYFASFDGQTLTPMEAKSPTSFRQNTHARHVRGMTSIVEQNAREPLGPMREVYKEVFGTERVGVVPGIVGSEVAVEPLTAEQVQAADELEKQRKAQVRKGKKSKSKSTSNASTQSGTKQGKKTSGQQSTGQGQSAQPATATPPSQPIAQDDELELLQRYLDDDEEETL